MVVGAHGGERACEFLERFYFRYLRRYTLAELLEGVTPALTKKLKDESEHFSCGEDIGRENILSGDEKERDSNESKNPRY